MPYEITADLRKKSHASAIDIVTSFGEWSACHEDTLSFTHEVEGEYLEVRRKDGGRECLVPKVYGAWLGLVKTKGNYRAKRGSFRRVIIANAVRKQPGMGHP